MAKKGNTRQTELGSGDDGFAKQSQEEVSQKNLDTTRRQMESANLDQEQRNRLLEKEVKLVEKIVQVRGKEVRQVLDLSAVYDEMYNTMQDQTNTTEQLYGVQNKLADKLQFAASQAQEFATIQRQTRDMSLEDLNINQRTQNDLSELNRLKLTELNYAQKLTLFNKNSIPYYDEIKKIQAEVAILTVKVGDDVNTENAHRLKVLKTLGKQYETLGKLEKKNERIEEMQGSINNLMTMQGTAAGDIFNIVKDIVTNPLLIFTGLLALGVSRFETMRGRGNELAEEMDRVNKKLAGAGPYQDAIIGRARKIHGIFRAAGEGFSSSMESAVDAVQALEQQLGNINFVTSDLVKTMTNLRLSIDLSDNEAAKVIDTYLIVDGLSEKAAINSANMLYSMSEQAGLNPAEVFREIAGATGETLAHFKGGGEYLNKAVISAKRMGLSLDDVAKISRGLLDFESSIEAEMEAQMLTGMDINFNKARMFAMNKEGAKAAEEVMRQVGGLERFRRMNIFQQEAIAKATGLEVSELLKSNVQREREAKIAREKQKIHKDTVKMLPVVTSVMGKLDTGLGVIEKISRILGDIVLDVFGVDFAKAEELILKFIKSDTFTTGLKNVLFFMKGVMEGIKSAIVTIWDTLKNMPWIGKFLQNMGKQDMSGGYDGAQSGGKFVGQAMAYGYMASKVLGLTPLTAMWVQSASGAMKGLGKGILDSVKGLFGGGGGAAAGGGSLPGQMSMFPKMVPHGAGVGSGAAAGGMSGGAMLGYGAAAAFVAKGAYDVLSLDNTNTSGEAAGAVGSLLGAAGGAKMGMMLGAIGGPIGMAVGAAIGAGVGYFGGQMVKHIEFFQNDLDKARTKLIKSENDLLLKKTMNNNKLRLEQVQASNAVRDSYVQLGLTTDGVTQKELRAFSQAQLDAGNITKDQFSAGLKGEITPLKLLELAAGGAAGQLGLEDQARKAWVEEQMTTDDISNYNDIELFKAQLKTVQSLTDDSLDDQITQKVLKQNNATPSNYVAGGVFTDEDMVKAGKMLYKLYDGSVDKKDIDLAVKNLSYISGTYLTKTDAMEKAMESVKDKLELGIQTKLSNAEFKHRTAELKYLEQSQKMVYDPTTGGLVVTLKDKPNKDYKAAGGLLEGPSHAQGGIQTKFGEMEGGEAVINKKSTAKYMGMLSRINEDQGGVAFDTGGVTGSQGKNRAIPKFHLGGTISGYGGKGDWNYSHDHPHGFSRKKMKDGTLRKQHHGKYARPAGMGGSQWTSYKNPGYSGFNLGSDDFLRNLDTTPYTKSEKGVNYRGPKGEAKGGWMQTQPYPDINKIRENMLGSMTEEQREAFLAKENYEGHLALDMLGFIPGYGNFADVANAVWYASEGNWGDAALSAASAIPGVGWLAGASKLSQGTKIGKSVNKYRDVVTSQGTVSNSILKATDNKPLLAGNTIINALHGQQIEGGGAGHGAVGPGVPPTMPPDYSIRADNTSVAPVYPQMEQGGIAGQLMSQLMNNNNTQGGFAKRGAITRNSPIQQNQNQHFRSLPVKRVNDMILTKDGQMIETHADDNLIAKKGGITQEKGGGSSNSAIGGGRSSNEMINLLRELIIVNKTARVKLDGAKLAQTINTANYING